MLLTIKCILGISSILLLAPAVVIALRWKLTKERHAKLIGYLDKKRAGLEIEPELQAEIAGVCEGLI